MPKLSIVIPAYNEAKFIGSLLEKIARVPIEASGFDREVIVVDDGSNDGTADIARAFSGVIVHSQSNAGKGAAVQQGVRLSTGDHVLVQDADLEYDPNDYIPMLAALRANPSAAVYGSRTLGQRRTQPAFTLFPGRHPDQSLGPWVANGALSVWTRLLYGTWITDTLTGYKMYPTAFLRSVQVKTRGFETDHELTSKLIRAGRLIVEVPVSYAPRSVAEGKKIGPRDGLIAMWTLLRFRIEAP